MSNARFSIIPGWIVTDARLKGRDLQVLCLLGRYTDRQGWCVRSQVKMAGQLNCARSTVQLSLDRLVSIGAVERRAGESRDGRDTSYWYRVIYDRAVAAEELTGWDEGESEGEGDGGLADQGAEKAGVALGIQSCEAGESGETPADISAPPADPASAPPADPGSAPYKNVPYITTPAERREREARERATDSDLEGKEGVHAATPHELDNPRRAEAAFYRSFKIWPRFDVSPKRPMLTEWAKLSSEDKAAAADAVGRFLDAGKREGVRHPVAISTYLSERMWTAHPKPDEAKAGATHSVEKPFGKGWGALRMFDLAQPPGPMPAPTHFIQSLIDAGGERGERERLQHQARHGWPRVNAMHAQAAERRGFHVPVEILPLGESFRQVRRGTPLWDAWRALHERRGRPWVPDGPEWIWMPAGDDPETAMAEFEKAVKAREADDDDEAA